MIEKRGDVLFRPGPVIGFVHPELDADGKDTAQHRETGNDGHAEGDPDGRRTKFETVCRHGRWHARGLLRTLRAAGHHCRARPYRQWLRTRKKRTGGEMPDGREDMSMGDGKSGLQLRSLVKK